MISALSSNLGWHRCSRASGCGCTQSLVIDPEQHYATDPEMVAVSGLEPHPITDNVSLTFFPGARALALLPTASGITAVPLIRSSEASYTDPWSPWRPARLALDTRCPTQRLSVSRSRNAATPHC